MAISVGWLNPTAIAGHCLRKRSFFVARRCSQSRRLLQACFYASAASHPESKERLESSFAKLWLPNERHTYMLGRLLAQDPRAGDVVLLHGELGAGKTSVARGYIHVARRDSSIEVTSPTFLLTNVYPVQACEGPLPAPQIYHMDLWRLKSASDRPLVDFDKVFTENISLIEWPDRLQKLLPSNRLDVMLQYPPPVPEDEKHDDSDPWGFGTGDLDDFNSSRSGRFVTLTAFGHSWRERIADLHLSTELSSDGNHTLVNV